MPQIFELPKQVVIDPLTGNPAPGAKAYFYETTTSTPKPVYSDASLTTPITQPVTADTAGVFQVIYLAAEGDYKLTLTRSDDSLLYTVDPLGNLTGITFLSTQLKYTITDAEQTAGVTPVQHFYNYGVPDRFAINSVPGTTDMRSAVQAAMSSSHAVKFLDDVEYYLSGSVTPQGNSVIEAGRGTLITIADGDTNGFDLTGLTGVTVRGLRIRCAGSTGTLGGISGKAAIYLSGSAQCVIENNFIFNIYNAGIRLYDSSNNTIQNNYFGDWYTTATPNDDAGNIMCFGACSYNTIDNNFCLGANAGIGIGITDYYLVGKQPIGNKITNNTVDGKKSYGILVYTTGTGSPSGFDCRTIVDHNVVSNIAGTGVSGASGAGIYLQGGGGAVCTNNTVYNCCTSTSNFGTLAMACITASITDAAQTAQILIANNHIHATRGPAIWAASSMQFGIRVEGNTIRHTQTSGGDSNAIVVSNCDYTSVTNNSIKQVFGTGIYCWTSGSFVSVNRNLTISGNTIDSTGSCLIQITRVTGGSWKDVVVSNNNAKTTGDQGFSTDHCDYMQVNGNSFTSDKYPIYFSGNTFTKASSNKFEGITSGSTLHIIGGTCTGSVFDETNAFIGGVIQNAATGLIITQYGTAAPSGSITCAVGHRVINSAPAVGSAKAWVCTVAGSPGTHVSEGNL